jgi:hypothetical protein
MTLEEFYELPEGALLFDGDSSSPGYIVLLPQTQ